MVREFAVVRDSADTRSSRKEIAWTHHGESSYNSNGSFPVLAISAQGPRMGRLFIARKRLAGSLEVPI